MGGGIKEEVTPKARKTKKTKAGRVNQQKVILQALDSVGDMSFDQLAEHLDIVNDTVTKGNYSRALKRLVEKEQVTEEDGIYSIASEFETKGEMLSAKDFKKQF